MNKKAKFVLQPYPMLNWVGRHIQQIFNLSMGIIFLIIFILIILMATKSRFNSHPDEYVQAEAVTYYLNHWLPPVVSDPGIRKSFSVYGHSRLVEFNPYYFLNGKFSVLAMYLVKDSLLSMRLFNGFLFFILMMLFFKGVREMKPLFLVLLISPQIWYLFSYVNSDAPALFLSILIVYQVVNDRSQFNKFLQSSTASGHFKGAVFIAILLALQIFSKKNYYLILVLFVIVMISYLIENKEQWKKISCKYLILIGLTLLFLAPRYLYDVKLHGFNRSLLISGYEEKYADPRFKHSSYQLDTSYFGLFLKEKGVKFSELFSEKWNWHKLTARSFFGIYGYMSIEGPNLYYLTMYFLISIFFGYLTVISIYQKPPAIRLLPLIFFSLLLLITFSSLYFSWVSDFQAQGRYLFSILGILGYWFVKNHDFDKSIFFKSVVVLIALTSLYSFVFVALPNILKV